MSKVAGTINSVTTDTASMRVWGAAISAAILSAGLVQTSDTGQVNWTTVTYPGGSVDVVVGYEMWRFNDSMQSTSPVFMKLEYVMHNGGPYPALRFSVGSATNGSGTLTGLYTSAFYSGIGVSGSANPNITTTPLWSCHTAGSFFIQIGSYSTSSSIYQTCSVSISRTVDMSGTITSSGVYIWNNSYVGGNIYSTSGFLNYTNNTTQTPNSGTGTPATASPTLGLASYDGNNKSYVLNHYCDPININPGLVCGIMTTRTTGSTYGGLSLGQQFSCKTSGPASSVSRNYLILGDGTQSTNTFSLNANWLLGANTVTSTTNSGAWNGWGFLWE